MLPSIILGGKHTDFRGTVKYNNTFNATEIKRFYVIENENTAIVRAWQGHKVEQRWFSAISGSFKIEIITVDNWDSPSKNLESITFIIHADSLDVLHIPSGNITSIQSKTSNAKLLVMSDYQLNEINDEFKFPSDYFNKKS